MDFTVLAANYSSFLLALLATVFCLIFATAAVFRKVKLGPSRSDCASPSEEREIDSEEMTARVSNGVSENGGEMAVERQSGASMMEQLVPEITTHALSYLDYPSLCRLSMTNSLMRKAANDDNAWKALYHKDFTLEQDNVTPPNGWKAYYAATRAIVTVNAEFFRIVRERSLQAMRQFWLNVDYVKCFHATGESFSGYQSHEVLVLDSGPPHYLLALDEICAETCYSPLNLFAFHYGYSCRVSLSPLLNHLYEYGIHELNKLFDSLSSYNAVMESWQLAFNWENVADFQIRDVRARVMSSMAWVTMKAYLDIGAEPFSVTNVYELHNGRWYMVHHHCSSMLIHGGGGQQVLHV